MNNVGAEGMERRGYKDERRSDGACSKDLKREDKGDTLLSEY